jgi:phage-related protein
MGSTKKDIRKLPEEVRSEIGYVLHLVQNGDSDSSIKPLTGKDLGGVYEICTDYKSDTYRAVYVLNLGDRIFMLHVFQKKSKRGSETPKPDMDKIRSRLKEAKVLAKELDDEQE